MSIKKARAALSHSVFTGVARNHLDRLVAELADPFHAAREGRLYRRRGGRDRRRWPGAGHPETLTLRDRVLVTLAWLRLALPHQALALWFGVDRRRSGPDPTAASPAGGALSVRSAPGCVADSGADGWTGRPSPRPRRTGSGRPTASPCSR
ncbi:hypothetical protein GCM10027452_00110 [Micromonospora halotolerans]